MKRIPFLLACLLALLLTALPRHARAEEVNFDFFYSSLADDGDWYNTPEYGYVFQPDIAFKNDKWRPYSDGYWAQTEDGWTWVSYENFGWATYHYGRWTRLADTGWVWVPGYEWGPGWVSWRANDDYVGWAPLPPKQERVAYEGRIVEPPPRRAPDTSYSLSYNDVEEDYDRGYGPAVDEDYGIGPDNYSFVECRQFGAPVIREVILPPERNFIFVENTFNVTSIYYRQDGDRRVVYCGGPSYDFVSHRSERPIQQLRLERREDLGFVRDGVRRGGNATLVRDGVLQVAAPLVARRDTNFQQMRPQRVKGDLQQPRVVRGWDNAKADPQQVQRLREKIKTQAAAPPRTQNAALAPGERPPNLKSGERPPGFERRPGDVRPGSIPPQPAAPAAAGPAAGPRQPLTDADRTARRDQRQREREERERARTSGQPVPPAGQPGRPQPPTAGQPGAELTDQERTARREKRDQARAARGQEQPAPAAQPDQPKPGAPQDRDARRTAREQARAARQQGQPTPAPQPQADQPAQPKPSAELTDQERTARREKRDQARTARGQEQPAPAAKPQTDAQGKQDGAGRRAAIQQQLDQQEQQDRAAKRASRQQERAAQPPPQPQADAGQQDRAARRAARQQEQAQQQQQQGQQQARAAQQQQQQEQARQAQQRAEMQRNMREAAQQQRMRQPQPQERPQPQARPQPQPQAQPQPQKQDDDDKKKKKRDNQ